MVRLTAANVTATIPSPTRIQIQDWTEIPDPGDEGEVPVPGRVSRLTWTCTSRLPLVQPWRLNEVTVTPLDRLVTEVRFPRMSSPVTAYRPSVSVVIFTEERDPSEPTNPKRSETFATGPPVEVTTVPHTLVVAFGAFPDPAASDTFTDTSRLPACQSRTVNEVTVTPVETPATDERFPVMLSPERANSPAGSVVTLRGVVKPCAAANWTRREMLAALVPVEVTTLPQTLVVTFDALPEALPGVHETSVTLTLIALVPETANTAGPVVELKTKFSVPARVDTEMLYTAA
jgi:hypothetical protein